MRIVVVVVVGDGGGVVVVIVVLLRLLYARPCAPPSDGPKVTGDKRFGWANPWEVRRTADQRNPGKPAPLA